MAHEIKITRARKLSGIGAYPASFQAALDTVPLATIGSVTGRQLAELIDTIFLSWSETKAIAVKDALADGGIWDARNHTFRALA